MAETLCGSPMYMVSVFEIRFFSMLLVMHLSESQC